MAPALQDDGETQSLFESAPELLVVGREARWWRGSCPRR